MNTLTNIIIKTKIFFLNYKATPICYQNLSLTEVHDYFFKYQPGQGYGFSCGHIWMWELDYKESWALKTWCFWTVVLEKTLESLLDCKEIQPVCSKGDQSWVFIGRTGAKAENPILWPPHAKSWLIGKDPDAGRDGGRRRKGTTEDEMAGWRHRHNGHEFEWTPGLGDGQRGLVCCHSWGCKESDTAEWLNWAELNWNIFGEIFSALQDIIGSSRRC